MASLRHHHLTFIYHICKSATRCSWFDLFATRCFCLCKMTTIWLMLSTILDAVKCLRQISCSVPNDWPTLIKIKFDLSITNRSFVCYFGTIILFYTEVKFEVTSCIVNMNTEDINSSKVCFFWINYLAGDITLRHLFQHNQRWCDCFRQQDQTNTVTCGHSEPRDPTSIKDILFRSPHLVPNVPSSAGSHTWNGACIIAHTASMILVATTQLLWHERR